MDIKVSAGDITQVDAEAAVVNLFQGVKQPGGATGAMDRAMDGAISGLIADGEIKGRKGEVTTSTPLVGYPRPGWWWLGWASRRTSIRTWSAR